MLQSVLTGVPSGLSQFFTEYKALKEEFDAVMNMPGVIDTHGDEGPDGEGRSRPSKKRPLATEEM